MTNREAASRLAALIFFPMSPAIEKPPYRVCQAFKLGFLVYRPTDSLSVDAEFRILVAIVTQRNRAKVWGFASRNAAFQYVVSVPQLTFH